MSYIFENGYTQSTPAGTPIPLLGVAYNTGTVLPVTAGDTTLTGTGTSWNTSAFGVGYWLKTAGGNKYKITGVLSNTELSIDRRGITEATAAYKIYRRPHTETVGVQSNVGNNNPYVYVGEDGYVGSTSTPAKGMRVHTAEGFKALDVDLAITDIWMDVSSNNDIVDWYLKKPQQF